MSSLTHASRTPDAWSSDVLPRLPADLDCQARALGAFQRSRAFRSPSDLLRGLLVYALSPRSLNQLGIWAVLASVAELAPSSWLERLRASTPWLRWLTGRLLAAPLRPRRLTQRLRGRLLLIDATSIGLARGPADAFRLHIAYDLLAGRFDQLLLSSNRQGECLSHFALAPGDLLIADSGYDSPADIAFAHQQRAQLLVRVYLPSLPLQQRNGQRLELLPWLRRSAEGGAVTVSLAVQLLHQGQPIALRLIAARLPREQRRAAERRFHKRRQRKGQASGALGLLLCSWLVLVTTLEEQEWSAEEVVALYRLRWQVEMRIKRLKQLVSGSRLRARTEASGEALLWAQLVGWALHEPTAQELRAHVSAAARRAGRAAAPGQQQAPVVVRSWQLSVLALESLRQALVGSWDEARLRACLPRLQRYLTSRLRTEHQEQEIRAWLWLTAQASSAARGAAVPVLPDFP